MKRSYASWLPVLVLAVCAGNGTPLTAQELRAGDIDAAIRASAKHFTQSFNQGDVKAVGSHFTDDAVLVNENGERFEGREAIVDEYRSLLKSTPDLKLAIQIDSTRVINAHTVIEEGHSAITPQPPGADRVISAYTAVHTLTADGKWLMSYVRDSRIDLPPATGSLEDLDWLIGTWVAQNEDGKVEVKARWIADKRFLARSHTISQSDQEVDSGLQIVGVDPSTGQITSWSFNGDGGHAVGRWLPVSDGWIIQSSGFTAEGLSTYALNNLKKKDDSSLIFSSTQRQAGQSTLPDIDEVILKRQ